MGCEGRVAGWPWRERDQARCFFLRRQTAGQSRSWGGRTNYGERERDGAAQPTRGGDGCGHTMSGRGRRLEETLGPLWKLRSSPGRPGWWFRNAKAGKGV